MTSRRATVLVMLTDIEPAVRLNALLEAANVTTSLVSPIDDVRGEIERAQPELVVLTGALADPVNMHLARELVWEGIAVVGLADVADPQLLERLRGMGVIDVYAKPMDPADLFDVVRRALDRRRLASVSGLVGESEAIREVLVRVEQMAPVSSTVLIEGESGTGKELVARAIHRLSPRRGGPFIAVNAGALPETLLESELFGHEKGSFTGAAERRLGRFELADRGTLFLDEIGEIAPATQVRLLRVLEEREVTRVGGAAPIAVDVRVVAATNQPLRQLMEGGRFRSDLYYRLNVLSIYLPPLRARRDDIPLLVRRFVKEFGARHDRPFYGISAEAMQLMADYSWPGNVRELRNLVESMVVLSPGREISAADIPAHIREGAGARFLPVHVGPMLRQAAGSEGRELEFIVRSLIELKLQVENLRRRVDEGSAARAPALPSGAGSQGEDPAPTGAATGAPEQMFSRAGGIAPPAAPPAPSVTIEPGTTMAEIERAAIEAALRATRGNRRRAAEMLGIGERTMYRKLRDYSIPIAASALD